MIGLNILAQYVHNRAALLAWARSSNAGAFVCMDDPALALALHNAAPNAVVVHRSHSGFDKRWHTALSPSDWLRTYRSTIPTGVVAQVFNEPEIGDLDTFLDWLEELVRLCPADLTLCLPNFAVGNPHEDLIRNGAFDRLLGLVCGTRHYLGLHEYFKTDPFGESPYLCGRFTYWLDRAKTLGLPRPKIILTEHGRDVGGQRGDGWRGTDWSEDRYADLLMQTHLRLYLPHGIPVCVFGYGDGADREWQSFSVEGADTVLRRIAEYNQMTQPPTQQRQATANVALNLRPTPSTAQVQLVRIPAGASFAIWQQPVLLGDGLSWVNAAYDGKQGFVAVSVNGAVTYAIKETEPPPPDGVYSENLTDDEIQQLITFHSGIAAVYKALWERRNQA